MDKIFDAEAGAAGDPGAHVPAVVSGEFIVYSTEDGHTEVHLRTTDGTVWLTQAQMADLFQTTPQAITQLIRAIYEDVELSEEATCKEFLQVRREGNRTVRRALKMYRLELILAVGYRVRSLRGIEFRRWASTVLREYLIKGFVMNDARLKEPQGADYFDELLARIRDIRASEKRFYQKVKDVFSASSIDYDPKASVAQTFFKTIQNKLLYAVSGRTAAEIIVDRCDVSKPNMGLTSWKGNLVRKGDVDIAKNYLEEKEIQDLNRITTMFLDFAEDRAARRERIAMADWVGQTDRFLQFYERDVLQNAGAISADEAKRVSAERYGEFDARRRQIENEGDDIDVLEAVQREIEKRAE